MNHTGSKTDENVSMVSRFIDPEGTWKLLEAVKLAEPTRLGVVVVSTQKLKGRIGFFCNQIISGACVDSTGETGMVALKQLLEQGKGMFAFRPCMGNDAAELGQSLAVQIDELLSQKPADLSQSAAQILTRIRTFEPTVAPGSGEPETVSPENCVKEDDASGNALPENSQPAPQAIPAPDILVAPPNLGDPEFITQSGTFTAYGFNKQADKAQSKFGKLLSMAPDGIQKQPQQPLQEEEQDVDAYNKLLEKQRKKVEADLLALQKGPNSNATVSGGKEEELQMLVDFLYYEQQRVTGSWQRDEIDGQNLLQPKAESNQTDSGSRRKGPDSPAHSVHAVTPGAEPKGFTIPRWLFVSVPLLLGVAGIALFLLINTESTVDKLINSGEQNLKNNKNDQAMADFNSAISLAAENPRAHYYRALAYTRLGKYDDADNDFVTAQKLGMAPTILALARAGAQCKKGDFDNALDTINYLIERQPNNARAYILRGTCEQHLGATDESLEDLGKAIALAKEPEVQARAFLERATTQMHDKKKPAALDDLAKSIALQPTDAALLMHATLSRENRDPQAAVTDYTQVLKNNDHNIEALIARGIAYSNLNDDESAVKDFSRAIELDKTALEAYIQRGTVLLRDGDYKAAADDLRVSMKLSPGLPEAQAKLQIANSHLKPSER